MLSSKWFRFQISGQQTGWCSQYGGCQAIVDTGTPSLTAPSNVLSSLMQSIGAQQNSYGEVLTHIKKLIKFKLVNLKMLNYLQGKKVHGVKRCILIMKAFTCALHHEINYYKWDRKCCDHNSLQMRKATKNQ